MQVIIKKNYEEMSREGARVVAEEMKKKQASKQLIKLGLATGSTPIGLYKELIRMYKKEGLDFSTTVTFNLDEYIGLDHGHPQSYYYFMWHNLFKSININPKNIHVPDGKAKDPEAFCDLYEESIRESGGLDIQLLGLGRDGHIGFNEPMSSLASRTRIKTLTEETIEDNARFFKSKSRVPKYAITMGVGTIMEAKKVLILASGTNKAEALAAAVEGPVTSEITASVLQMHPYVIVICDEEAAANLKRADYYNHVYKGTKIFKSAMM